MKNLNSGFSYPILAPSLLSADFGKLDSEISEMESLGINWLHVDVMDGHFVPNLTLGPVVLQSIRPKTKCFLDCHLMVNEPEKFFPWFAKAGADLITFHVEAVLGEENQRRAIQAIKSLGVLAGISIKPNTSIEAIQSLLPELDLVLVMSVNPGFGGQKFIPESLAKVRELVSLRQQGTSQTGPMKFKIEIDGGINSETAALCSAAGVEIFVAGNAIFAAADRKSAVKDLEKAIR